MNNCALDSFKLPRYHKLQPYAAEQYLLTARICSVGWEKAKLSLIFTVLSISCACFSLQSWTISPSWWRPWPRCSARSTQRSGRPHSLRGFGRGSSPPRVLHHIDGFALAAGRVLVCAELDVVCITELLTRLEHQLCSMPTWRKHDDVICIPNYTHVYTERLIRTKYVIQKFSSCPELSLNICYVFLNLPQRSTSDRLKT